MFRLRLPGIARDGGPPPPSPADTLWALMNAARAGHGLSPYRRSAILDRAAQIRCDDLVARNYFSHTTPDGVTGYTAALSSLGVSWAWAGENLAGNNYPLERTAQIAHEGLMGSPTHRANILEPRDFDAAGVAYAFRPHDGWHLFTQIFHSGGGV